MVLVIIFDNPSCAFVAVGTAGAIIGVCWDFWYLPPGNLFEACIHPNCTSISPACVRTGSSKHYLYLLARSRDSASETGRGHSPVRGFSMSVAFFWRSEMRFRNSGVIYLTEQKLGFEQFLRLSCKFSMKTTFTALHCFLSYLFRSISCLGFLSSAFFSRCKLMDPAAKLIVFVPYLVIFCAVATKPDFRSKSLPYLLTTVLVTSRWFEFRVQSSYLC